jgi:putative endonuclease
MGIARVHGVAGETLAAAYLTLAGCEVVAQNTRIADVEVDVLAREHDTAVIVEVKFRMRGDYGGAALAVSRLQQERLVRAARVLATQHAGPVRVDVIAIDLEEDGLAVRHYRNALTG